MLAKLRARTGLRAFVALAAAYVIVLQASLSAILVPQMALASAGTSDLLVICHSDAGDPGAALPGSQLPLCHESCAVCVQTHATDGAAVPGVPALVRRVTYARFTLPQPTAPPPARTHTPRTSQGPPQTA